MNKFFIYSTKYCDGRMLDCQRIHNYLLINGWVQVKKVSKANLVIIGTCSYSKLEEDSSVDFIKYFNRKKCDSALMVVTGCLSKVNPSRLKNIQGLVLLSPTDLERLDEIVKPHTPLSKIKEPNIVVPTQVINNELFKRMFVLRNYLTRSIGLPELYNQVKSIVHYILLTKSYINPLLVCKGNDYFCLRISKGCLGRCSYCAIRFSTGNLISREISEIVNDFRSGLKSGRKTFYVTAEDAGSYGQDTGTDIVKLLKEIFACGLGYDYKIILTNLNAHWFLKYYAELERMLMEHQYKIFYVQIPIQSASNRILKLMNRPYNIEEVKMCLLSLQSKIPGLNIATDIIVGFPGETEEDFNMTKDLISRINFSFVDVFSYEDRPNTAASLMGGKVSREVINARKLELSRIQNKRTKTTAIVKKIKEIAKDLS